MNASPSPRRSSRTPRKPRAFVAGATTGDFDAGVPLGLLTSPPAAAARGPRRTNAAATQPAQPAAAPHRRTSTAAAQHPTTPQKPVLRGVSHLLAAVPALVGSLVLAQRAADTYLAAGCIIYGTTLTLLLCVSGYYHTPHWAPAARSRLRRIDRSMVFLLLGGAATPFLQVGPTFGGTGGVGGVGGTGGTGGGTESSFQGIDAAWALPAVWTGALLGAAKTCFFPHAPRALVSLMYVGLGLVIAPFLPSILVRVGPAPVALLVAAGVSCAVGAVAYARKAPNPVPGWFGYHEVLHVFILLGLALHFAGTWWIVEGLRAAAGDRGVVGGGRGGYGTDAYHAPREI